MAQSCLRPVPPPGGFPISVELTVPVSYSDGYQTFGVMQMPSDPAPSCGWPLIVYVHTLGGSRFDDFALQTKLAEQGFAVWGYDVRGQGEAALVNIAHPNEGTNFWGPVEGHDLAEQISMIAADPQYANIIDATRVAVVGRSQGGAHAWMAAAHSGDLLQMPGRADVQMPAFACAVAHDLISNSHEDWLRRGLLFSSWWVNAISGSYQAGPLSPDLVAAGEAAFLSQDPATLAASLAAAGRDLNAGLAASTVPFLYEHAFLDNVNSALFGLESLESMQGPTRAVMSTIGHGPSPNDYELDWRRELALRWCNRFLWDVPNEVDLERRHLLASVPLDPALREDPQHLWGHVRVNELTTPPTAQRLYLHDDFTLSSTTDRSPVVQPTIVQVIDPLATDFTPLDYLYTPAIRETAGLLARCPLSELVWSLTTAGDRQLVRSTTVHLRVEPGAESWMVAALLTAQPPGGDEVMLSHNAIASRSSVIGVTEAHDLRLPPVATALPAGTVLRLRLRNIWLREAPMENRTEVAPMFHDFTAGIVIDDGVVEGSWIDLPLDPLEPRLVVDRTVIDLDQAQAVDVQIRGGVDRAGAPCFAMVGLSGQYPTTPFFGSEIPIEIDWLVIASAGSGDNTYYTGFFNLLDANGEMNCSFDYTSAAPMPQLLNGMQLTVCAYTWDGPVALTGAPTNAVTVALR